MVFGGEEVGMLLNVVVVAEVAAERFLGEFGMGEKLGGNLAVAVDKVDALENTPPADISISTQHIVHCYLVVLIKSRGSFSNEPRLKINDPRRVNTTVTMTLPPSYHSGSSENVSPRINFHHSWLFELTRRHS